MPPSKKRSRTTQPATISKKARVKRASAQKIHPNNLNTRFAASLQAVRKAPQSFDHVQNVSIFFDDIESHLLALIRNPQVYYVLAASPWFSNQKMLAALAEKRGVGILTQREKHSLSGIRSKAYSAITPFDQGFDRVRTLNHGRGRQCAITHSKFLVFLDSDRRPIGCAYGSHNFSTMGGQINLEMFCAVNDTRVAATLAAEWHRIYSVSRRLIP